MPGVSNSAKYGALGNGWNVDTISHIFKGLKKGVVIIDNKALGRLLANKPKLTRQQYKTLKGQILAGDAEGAMRGLNKLTNSAHAEKLNNERSQ